MPYSPSEVEEETPLQPKQPAKKKGGAFAFANTEDIKKKVRQTQLNVPPYDVSMYYKEHGFFRRLATSEKFINFTLGVIIANAFWMAYDCDNNAASTITEAEPIFVIGDCLFFGFFFLELSVRFLAFKKKSDCLKDGWFRFDTLLVMLYAFDPFILGIYAASTGQSKPDLPTSVLRLFRLARLSRLVRMLRSFPQLMCMIKGMVTAAASVTYTLFLLMIITYVFSIAFRNLVPEKSEIEKTYFPSVYQSIISLAMYGVFLDALSDFLLAVEDDSTVCFIMCWIYIALASLTVMNMLIGVLCEVITAVGAEENESETVRTINERFENVDQASSTAGQLSWEEFEKVVEDPDNIQSLRDVGVDPESMIDLAHDYFHSDGQVENTVSTSEFMEIVLDARGGQPTTVKDVMHLGKRFNQKFGGLTKKMDEIHEMLDELLEN